MKKQTMLIMLMMLLLGLCLCGCGSSETAELQKQMEELQKQNEELNAKLDEMNKTPTPTQTPTVTPTPTNTPTPTPTPTNTPTPTPTEEMIIEENLDKLKDYIIANGNDDEDEEGSKTIVHSLDDSGKTFFVITYNSSKDSFMFRMLVSEDGLATLLEFEWGKLQHKNTVVNGIFVYEDALYTCAAEAKLDGATYSGDNLDFIVTECTYEVASFEEAAKELMNTQMKVGMITFDALLLPKCGLSLSDIGFKAFEFSSDKTADNTTTNSQPTTSQQQAVKMAKSYLDSIAFSRTGLIEQLEYEGFSKSDATYGVDNCGANWYEQAVKCAKSYLDSMAFSRSGLIEQLEYEGFTYDQAVYGVEQNGL